MPTTQSPSKQKNAKQKDAKQKANRVRTKIKEQVIALLGKPDDLYRIDICLYQAGRARVNIWRREMTRAKKQGGFLGKSELTEITHITDSHYLHLSKTAVIESANPPIERRY